MAVSYLEEQAKSRTEFCFVNDPISAHNEYLKNPEASELDTVQSRDPNDPLNLPVWKKNVHLMLMAFHGLFVTANAGAVLTAVGDWAEEYNVSISAASYIATCQLIAIAIGPLIFTPIADRWGRLPIFMISALGASLFNLACGECSNYGEHITFRILGGLFISPGVSLAQGVIVDMFEIKQRGQKMGIWLLFANAGSGLGPALMGFLQQAAGWRWVYRAFAIMEFALFVLYYLFSPETLYRPSHDSVVNAEIGQESPEAPKRRSHWLRFIQRIDPTPLHAADFLRPILLLRLWNILLVNIAYSVAHNFVLTMLLVEMSSLYEPIFGLDPQQTGLNYFTLLVGLLLGEQCAGPLSDYLRNRQLKRRQGAPAPEDRLWIAQIGIPLVIVGVVVFFIEIANAEGGRWNIKPDIGVGIACFGVQIVATVCVTYCSDSCPPEESASLGVSINMVKLLWGFVSPFWYPVMISSCGLKGSAGIVAGLTIAFTAVPLAGLFLYSRYKRQE